MATKPVHSRETPALTAIYLRLSQGDGDRDDGQMSGSIDRQLADTTGLCRRNGWDYLQPFIDDDFSASMYAHKARPAYTEMMRRVRGGEIGRIVCYDVDRLYRQPKELEELIDLASTGKVSIISMSGDLDLSTGDGRFVARILVNMAAKASDDTSRRIRQANAAARQKGLSAGGSRPAFGWKDRMTPDPVESKLLADACKAVVAGESVLGIARAWHHAGVPTKYGGKSWDQAGVSEMLVNPRHAGLVHHRGEVVGPAVWPAIISRELHEAVVAAIADRGRHLVGKNHAMHELSSTLTCGRCGNHLSRAKINKKPSWRCLRQPSRGCNGVSVIASALEARLYRVLFLYVDGMELASLVDAGAGDEQAILVGRLTELERREDEAADMFRDGTIDRRIFARIRDGLLADRAAATQRLSRLGTRNVLAPYAGRGGVLEAAWDGLSVDVRRSLLVAALAPIILLQGKGPKFDVDRVRFGKDQQTAEQLLDRQAG